MDSVCPAPVKKYVMKAVMIVHNQALTEKIDYVLIKLGLRGFTRFPDVVGRGSEKGNPRMGTHTWPEMNSAMLVVTEEDKVKPLLDLVKKVDSLNEEVGVRAFVWDITETA